MGHDCRRETQPGSPTAPQSVQNIAQTMTHQTALETLNRMTATLTACVQGSVPQSTLIQQWRTDGPLLPLPDKFALVLGDLLDRMEASALFSEESCSFSQKGLLDNLQLWADKAHIKLSQQA